MEILKLNYIEKNGILYPDIQISNDANADKRPMGKYGMMWLRFMKEFHHDDYTHHFLKGDLTEIAHKVNDESHEMIDGMLNRKSTSMDRHIIEENIIKEFVLKNR